MKDRIAKLDALQIMDTAPEPEFDNIALVAKSLLDAPVALISLVHRNRQWFKARIGFDPSETPINQSICAHALQETELLVIPDLQLDPRSRDNPLVMDAPGIRFYAGAPIIVDGTAIGSLCVIDLQPRPEGITEAQATGLTALAAQVSAQIASRQRERGLLDKAEQENASLNQALRRSAALAQLVDAIKETDELPELLRRGSGILASVIPSTRAGFGIVDVTRETVEMQPEWRADGVTSVAGMHHFRDYGSYLEDLKRGEVVIIPDVETDPRTADSADALLAIGIRLLINVPVIQAGRFSAVGFVHSDRRAELSDEDASFIRTLADRMQAAIQHKRMQEERNLLNRELIHRVKNTLALVSAVARQTFHSTDESGRVDAFLQRLQAVAVANDLLTQENWEASNLHAVITRAIAISGDAQRIVLDGPEQRLGSQAAISATMLFHELLTNSMKYGALSTLEGRVSIRWQLRQDGPHPALRLVWTESGGPAVIAPENHGFGSRIIEMGLAGNGGAEVDFAPSGLVARFHADLPELGA